MENSKNIKHKVILFTHYSPVIHGQAMMANQLLEYSINWNDIEIIPINTVFAKKRTELGGFSLGKIWMLYKCISKIRRLLKTESIEDVIICPSFKYGSFLKDALVVSAIRKLIKGRLIGWIHMDPNRLEYEHKQKWYRKLVDRTLSKFDVLVACAPGLINLWPEWIKNSCRVEAIANGIPHIQKDDQMKINGAINVMFLSAIDEQKGLKEFLEVSDALCDSNDKFNFNVYGGLGVGVSLEDAENYFKSLRNGNRIIWHGPVYGEDKDEAFRANHLFVLPSHTEQFSIAILEAMSFGLAITASDVGAMSDAIDKEFLFDPQCKESMDEKIRAICHDKKRLIEIGERNKSKFSNLFSADKFSESWRRLLVEK